MEPSRTSSATFARPITLELKAHSRDVIISNETEQLMGKNQTRRTYTILLFINNIIGTEDGPMVMIINQSAGVRPATIGVDYCKYHRPNPSCHLWMFLS